MLTNCVGENFPEAELLEFCDNGWSRKNFERPGVKALLEQVRQGKIGCIVVKDLSRFERDYITVGNYISRVFPFLGVRFFALGDWVCGFTPFGYVKDPKNINHLIADPKAAETIQHIFQMAIDGVGTLEIARALNAQSVPTPMRHKLSIGTPQKFMTSIHEGNHWMQSAVARILRDERYTGENIYGRRTRDIVGDPHTLQADRDTWVVVEDSHDVIITQQEFDRAQESLRAFRLHPTTRRTDRPLRGKVFCGVCGHAMAHSNGKAAEFYCTSVRVAASDWHPALRVPEADVLEAVLAAIRTCARCAVEVERLSAATTGRKKLDQKAAFDTLHTLQMKQEQLLRQIQRLYEALVEGAVTREDYAKKKQVLSAQLQQIETDMSVLEEKISMQNHAREVAVIARYRDYEAIDALTAEAAADLLDRVTVHPDGVLDIRLNDADELEALLARELGEAV